MQLQEIKCTCIIYLSFLLLFSLHLYGCMFLPQFSLVFLKITVSVHCHYQYIVLCYNFYKKKDLKLSPQCLKSQQSLSICNILFSSLSSARIWWWSGVSSPQEQLLQNTPCVARWTKSQLERDCRILRTMHLEKCKRKRK